MIQSPKKSPRTPSLLKAFLAAWGRYLTVNGLIMPEQLAMTIWERLELSIQAEEAAQPTRQHRVNSGGDSSNNSSEGWQVKRLAPTEPIDFTARHHLRPPKK